MKEMTENRSELRGVHQRIISNTEERVNLAAKQNLGSNSERMKVTWKYVTYFRNDYSLDDILHLPSTITHNLPPFIFFLPLVMPSNQNQTLLWRMSSVISV